MLICGQHRRKVLSLQDLYLLIRLLKQPVREHTVNTSNDQFWTYFHIFNLQHTSRPVSATIPDCYKVCYYLHHTIMADAALAREETFSSLAVHR